MTDEIKPQDEMSPRGQESDMSDGGWLVAILFVPVLVLVFTALILVLAWSLDSSGDLEFGKFLAGVSNLVGSQADGGNFSVGTGLGTLAVLSALVVALAFYRPPGGFESLPRGTQKLITTVVGGVYLVLTMLSVLAVLSLIAAPVELEVVFLLIVAWLVASMTGLVNLRRSTSDLLAASNLRLTKYVGSLEKQGHLPQGRLADMPQIGRANWAFWGVPLLLAGLPILGMLWDYRGGSVQPEAWSVYLFGPIATLLMQIGWWISRAYPPREIEVKLPRWLTGIIGTTLWLIVGMMGLLAKSYAFFAVSALVGLLIVSMFWSTWLADKAWFLCRLRRVATVKKLEELTAERDKALVRHQTETNRLEREAKEAKALISRPFLRIELSNPFRRRI